MRRNFHPRASVGTGRINLRGGLSIRRIVSLAIGVRQFTWSYMVGRRREAPPALGISGADWDIGLPAYIGASVLPVA